MDGLEEEEVDGFDGEGLAEEVVEGAEGLEEDEDEDDAVVEEGLEDLRTEEREAERKDRADGLEVTNAFSSALGKYTGSKRKEGERGKNEENIKSSKKRS